MSERVLFVDDEPNLLATIQRTLGRRYAITLAGSGAAALAEFDRGDPIAVIVSDMRMPGMSGVELLHALERRSPDTIRIILTGDAERSTAIDAVNQAGVFRFLNKPVATPALQAALDEALGQYRLRRAEKDLLENTLGATVKVLVDILAATDPSSFNRTIAIKEHARDIAGIVAPGSLWQIELAAMLSQVGWVAVPPEVRAAMREGRPLTEVEAALVERVPQTGEDFIKAIPRLELVARIVGLQRRGFDGSGTPAGAPSGTDLPLGARILRVASDLAAVEAKGVSAEAALARLSAQPRPYDPAVLAAAVAIGATGARRTDAALDVTLAQLLPGDVLISPLQTLSGQLVLAADHRLSEVTLARLLGLSKIHALKQPITVKRSQFR